MIMRLKYAGQYFELLGPKSAAQGLTASHCAVLSCVETCIHLLQPEGVVCDIYNPSRLSPRQGYAVVEHNIATDRAHLKFTQSTAQPGAGDNGNMNRNISERGIHQHDSTEDRHTLQYIYAPAACHDQTLHHTFQPYTAQYDKDPAPCKAC